MHVVLALLQVSSVAAASAVAACCIYKRVACSKLRLIGLDLPGCMHVDV